MSHHFEDEELDQEEYESEENSDSEEEITELEFDNYGRLHDRHRKSIEDEDEIFFPEE